MIVGGRHVITRLLFNASKLYKNNTYKFIFQNFLTFAKKYANIGSIKVIQKGLNEYLLKIVFIKVL
jgi:hypothetical protein